MCTSISFTCGNLYFGRTLDIECGFGEHVVITPRRYPLKFRLAGEASKHYAIIGMAADENSFPLYAEAANEKGLCMAGLSFPDNTFYPEEKSEEKTNISPFELIPWVLGQCACIDETLELLESTHITAIPFSSGIPLSPLHWHIADKNRSIVLEAVRDGLKIYDNPVGVMTNNPTFDFHISNLRQYLNVSPNYPENRFGTELKPFGNGFGGMGLPGDFSPCSRFVRAAFLRANSVTDEYQVSQFFHILENVALVKGSVFTCSGKADYTIYSCCINADKGIYYYTTYTNRRINAIDMLRTDLDSVSLINFSLDRTEDIRFIN